MRNIATILLLAGMIFLSGCITTASNVRNPIGGDDMLGKQVKFPGANGFELSGTLWENSSSSKPPLLLVHQLGRDRHSFDAFAALAFESGYSVLSFDLRGHGESRPGNVSYLNYSPADWQLIAKDIQAARNYLNVEKVLVIGASIGANASLNFGAKESSCAGMVLLSPGLDYRGLTTSQAVQSNQCPFLIVASKEDQYAAQSSQSLFSLSGIADKRLVVIQNAGHGTDMLSLRTTLSKEILNWLDAHAGS